MSFESTLQHGPDAGNREDLETAVAQTAANGLHMEQALGAQAKSEAGVQAAGILEAITTVAMQKLEAAAQQEANRAPDSQKVLMDKILARWDKFSDAERHHLKATFPELLASMQ